MIAFTRGSPGFWVSWIQGRDSDESLCNRLRAAGLEANMSTSKASTSDRSSSAVGHEVLSSFVR